MKIRQLIQRLSSLCSYFIYKLSKMASQNWINKDYWKYLYQPHSHGWAERDSSLQMGKWLGFYYKGKEGRFSHLVDFWAERRSSSDWRGHCLSLKTVCHTFCHPIWKNVTLLCPHLGKECYLSQFLWLPSFQGNWPKIRVLLGWHYLLESLQMSQG